MKAAFNFTSFMYYIEEGGERVRGRKGVWGREREGEGEGVYEREEKQRKGERERE